MNVGETIRTLREKTGYSQIRFAEFAGISQTHLRRVELGQADITVGHLQLICDALGMTLKDFFNIDDEREELSSAISSLTPKQKKLLLEFLKSL